MMITNARDKGVLANASFNVDSQTRVYPRLGLDTDYPVFRPDYPEQPDIPFRHDLEILRCAPAQYSGQCLGASAVCSAGRDGADRPATVDKTIPAARRLADHSRKLPATADPPFYLHDFHIKQVGLDCDACHVPAKKGSVILERPGHDQCTHLPPGRFQQGHQEKICVQCHTVFPPTSAEDLLPFPRYKVEQPDRL